jgi:hypothetical protein
MTAPVHQSNPHRAPPEKRDALAIESGRGASCLVELGGNRDSHVGRLYVPRRMPRNVHAKVRFSGFERSRSSAGRSAVQAVTAETMRMPR